MIPDRLATADDAPTAPTPAEELATFTAWASAIFYWAEAGENPYVCTYIDAYHYVATSLSVGYAHIYPVTQLGKMVGAAVMMVGPALAARALDGERAPDGGAAIAEKLDAILEELRRANAHQSAAG